MYTLIENLFIHLMNHSYLYGCLKKPTTMLNRHNKKRKKDSVYGLKILVQLLGKSILGIFYCVVSS